MKIEVDMAKAVKQLEDNPELANQINELILGSEMAGMLDLASKIVIVVQKFVKDNRIYCVETIYQTDRVIEHAYEFIEELVELVGYHEDIS